MGTTDGRRKEERILKKKEEREEEGRRHIAVCIRNLIGVSSLLYKKFLLLLFCSTFLY